MIRFLLRAVGLWVLAAGFVAAVIDGMRSIAASTFVTTSALASWGELAPGTLGVVRTTLEGKVGTFAWSPLTTSLLALPAWALLAVIGAALIALGRPRAAPIGIAP